jgi:hypothetical protein
MPRSPVGRTHYFPKNRGKRKPRGMNKARGEPWPSEDGLNGGGLTEVRHDHDRLDFFRPDDRSNP